jgi:hypothetical protein
MNPCVNNGTCVDVTSGGNDENRSYRCICPDLVSFGDNRFPVATRLLGDNCEYLSICDTMPCGARGTCVTLDVPDNLLNRNVDELPPQVSSSGRSRGYQCVCDDGFEGVDCSRRVGAKMEEEVAKEPRLNPVEVRGKESCCLMI